MDAPGCQSWNTINRERPGYWISTHIVRLKQQLHLVSSKVMPVNLYPAPFSRIQQSPIIISPPPASHALPPRPGSLAMGMAHPHPAMSMMTGGAPPVAGQSLSMQASRIPGAVLMNGLASTSPDYCAEGDDSSTFFSLSMNVIRPLYPTQFFGVRWTSLPIQRERLLRATISPGITTRADSACWRIRKRCLCIRRRHARFSAP